MFHRFVLNKSKINPDNQGLLSYACEVCKDNELQKHLDWFNHHVPGPNFKNIPYGVFWFKDNQKKAINKMQELSIFIFDTLKIESSYLIAEELGSVFWQDHSQIVANFKRKKWIIIS